MKNLTRFAGMLLGASLLASGAQAQDFMKPQTAADLDDVYFLAQLQIEDFAAFQKKYVPGVDPLLRKANTSVLVATPTPTTLEGEWKSNWTVLLRFDDQATFDAFYKSNDYQAELVPLRQEITSVNNLVILPAFDPKSMMGN